MICGSGRGEMNSTIRFTIDGREAHASPGETILQVA
jgi:hypothetical protein